MKLQVKSLQKKLVMRLVLVRKELVIVSAVKMLNILITEVLKSTVLIKTSGQNKEFKTLPKANLFKLTEESSSWAHNLLYHYS